MKKPDWQTNFRDLPTIPEHKQWTGNSRVTLEQTISFKLLNRQPITREEEEIFKNLSSFYSDLDYKLRTIDYTTFDSKDLENFKNYIFYAFNYVALVTNELTIYTTYRLVINESVLGNNDRITHIDYLKYPSLDIVRKINKFNRANTPNTNIFYSTENIDTALKEQRPSLNKLLTVGIWVPKSKRKFISFPISHSDIAGQVNEGVAKATSALDEHGNYNSSLFINYMRYYFKLLGREYTKIVQNHYEYFISASFSESILETHDDPNPNFRFDCIIYPSVVNGYLTSNLALRPSVIDNDFFLAKVIEFEVESEYYDKPYVLTHPENITLASIKNVKSTTRIDREGNIIW